MYLRAKTLKICDHVWFDDDSGYIPINSLYRRDNGGISIHLTINGRQIQWDVKSDEVIRVRKVVFTQYVKTGDRILLDNKVWFVYNRGHVASNDPNGFSYMVKLSLVPNDNLYTKPIEKLYKFSDEIIVESVPLWSD